MRRLRFWVCVCLAAAVSAGPMMPGPGMPLSVKAAGTSTTAVNLDAYTPIEVNQPQTLEIENGKTNDFKMKFTLPQRGYIKITFNRIIGSFGKAMPVQLNLTDAQGNYYISQYLDPDHPSDGADYIGLAGGQYEVDFSQILMSQYLSNDPGPWNVTFNVEYTPDNSWEIENNDTIVTANPIELNQDTFGVLGDDDWFKFTLEKQENIRFKMKLLDSTNYYSPYQLEIYNKDGEICYVPYANLKSDGQFNDYVLNNLAAGTYYLGIISSEDLRYQLDVNNIPTSPEVNSLADNQTEITGTAEPSTTVTAETDGTELGQTIADENGNFSIKIDKQTAGKNVSVYCVDSQGNKSEPTIITVADKTAPAPPAVNPVDDRNYQFITGTAEPNSKVIFSKNGEKIGEYAANSYGNFYIYTYPTLYAGDSLEFVSVDGSGNASDPYKMQVLDKTPPAIPTVDLVTNKSMAIAGQAEPGTTVIAYNDGVEVSRGTADSTGAYSLPLTEPLSGGSIQVTSIDGGGNSTLSGRAKAVILIPADAQIEPVSNLDEAVKINTIDAYSIQILIDGVVTQTLYPPYNEVTVNIGRQKPGTQIKVISANYDGYHNDGVTVTVSDQFSVLKPTVADVGDNDGVVTGTLKLSGTVADGVGPSMPGNLTAYAVVNHVVIGQGALDSNGDFSIPIPKQTAGSVLTVYADGDLGTTETDELEVKDKTAPAPPAFNAVSDQSTEVTGTAEPGSTVTIKNGAELYSTAADTNGNYKVVIPLGVNTGTVLVVTSTDAAGNTSSPVRIVVADKTAPASPLVGVVSNLSKEVTGSTEAGATITISSGTKKYSSKADIHGNYTVPVPIFTAGTVLVVTSTDAAGNASSPMRIVVADKTAPAPPIVSASVSDLSKVITGTTEAGVTVTAAIGSKKYTARADSKGSFKITVPLQKAGTKITVTAADAAGNISTARSVIVLDKTAPAAPKVNVVKRTTVLVTGIAEAYSTITIKVGSKIIGTGKADKYGKFAVRIKALKSKTTLSVTAADASKNSSKAVAVRVL